MEFSDGSDNNGLSDEEEKTNTTIDEDIDGFLSGWIDRIRYSYIIFKT